MKQKSIISYGNNKMTQHFNDKFYLKKYNNIQSEYRFLPHSCVMFSLTVDLSLPEGKLHLTKQAFRVCSYNRFSTENLLRN